MTTDMQAVIIEAIDALHEGRVGMKPGLEAYVDALYGLQDIVEANNSKRIEFQGQILEFKAPSRSMLETLRHVSRALPIETLDELPCVEVDDEGDGEITLTWFETEIKCMTISILPGAEWDGKVLASAWVGDDVKVFDYYAVDYHGLREFWNDHIRGRIMEETNDG